MRSYPPLLFSRLQDVSEFVYHYTSVEAAADHILPARTLLFGRYESTNDPKEFKNWTFGLGNVPPNAPNLDIEAISAELSTSIKRIAHVLCCGVDLPPSGDGHDLYIHHRGYARPRMWDQYGRKHKGVCLIFRRARLTDLLLAQFPHELVMTGRVVYQDRGFAPRLDHTEPYLVDYALLTQIGNEFYALEHIRRHHRALFFEKALDWRDENEFRWVVADGGAASICLEFEDALVGIAFGETCPEDSIRACVRLARRVGIDFEQLKWKNSAPWLSLRTDWALM